MSHVWTDVPEEDRDDLFRQFERVRDAGRVNMMSRSGVMVEADRLNCYGLVVLLAEMDGRTGRTGPDGRKAYMAFLDDFSAWKAAQA